MRKIDLVLAMGLPGSGKSTALRKLEKDYKETNPSVKYIDWDNAREAGWSSIENYVPICVDPKKSTKVKVLVDDLFTTITQVVSFVKHLQKQFDIQSLLILHFNLDRETCLKNDLGRREISSEHSIKKMQYDANVIADDFNCLDIPVVISEEQVVEKQGWHRFVKENVKDVVVDGKYLTSDYWTTGGSRSDLDGNSYSIGGDDPLEFEELDNLIEKVCPGITFMQYKHIMRDLKSANIVTIEDGSEGDYYGTWFTAWWRCDLEKFYNYLNEHNMIGENK